MRNFFFLFTFLSSALSYSYNVTTESQYKNALIEEFTGIYCSYCPQGHKIASDLMLYHPSRVYAVAIHAGYFAQAVYGDPDFRVDEGEEINDFFGISSYPSGDVNRRSFDGSVVLSRSVWGECCSIVAAETAPVNLLVSASYDAATALLTVEVEGYFVEAMDSARLSVMLLQNDVMGPQTGGQLGDEYMHQHMLRDIISDTWGDEIADTGQGSYFTASYSYAVPDSIGDVAVVVSDLEIVAFVAEGKENIVQVTGTYPTVIGVDVPFKADIEASLLTLKKGYAFDFIEVYLKNKCDEDITSATFDITLNGTTEQAEWSGTAPSHANTLIRVPLPDTWKEVQSMDDNSYSVEIVSANGNVLNVDDLDGEFDAIGTLPTELVFKITTDDFADDNTFHILDEEGNIVHEFGPYANGGAATYEETVSLNDGAIYCFEVTDAWGNGIYSPRGSVKVYDSNGTIKMQQTEIEDYGYRYFFVADATLGIGTLCVDDSDDGYTLFSLSGVEVAHGSGDVANSGVQKGVYVVKRAGGAERIVIR